MLIPTVNGREFYYNSVKRQLDSQKTNEVEILTLKTPMGIPTTGAKRNKLLTQAKGEYVVFVDDDDVISEDYITEILKHCDGVDCVGFRGWYTANGTRKREFETSITHTNKDLPNIYLRYINHICPIKRTIAMSCSFPDTCFGEDSAFSECLRQTGLLKTQNLIKKPLYHYKYRSKK